jgi:hypothetical protein
MGFLTPEVMEVGRILMEGLSCPRSLTVAILLREGEWGQIAELQCDPSVYNDADSFWRANVATSLFSKCRDLPLDLDLEAKAREQFFENERGCHRSNIRLEPLLWGRCDAALPEALHDFVARVKRRILYVIGPRPYSTTSEMVGRFGPGATMSDGSRCCTAPDKLSSVPTLTRDSDFVLSAWEQTAWARALANLGIEPQSERGNSFFTVPKKATALRACAKEPSLNGFYQLGLGRVARKRLFRRAGIDLDHGQQTHKQVACSSSKDGLFATIDLSSASDTVCKTLVKVLLPVEWYTYLSGLRSPFTKVGGRWVRLEKFSSMGNGYTFELETLLFWAISAECVGGSYGKEPLWVYGDDIIVPTHCSSDVLSALRFFGFTPNKGKTFTQGSFRESCGGDYFLGVDVRAHYLEECPHEPQDWIALANGLRRLGSKDPGCDGRWDRLRRAWFRCLDNIPSSIRACRGPEALGDLVIWDDESRWQFRWRSSRRWIKCYRPVPLTRVRWEGFAYEIQYAAALYLCAQIPGTPSGDTRVPREEGPGFPELRTEFRDHEGNLVPRDPVLGHKVGWTLFS